MELLTADQPKSFKVAMDYGLIFSWMCLRYLSANSPFPPCISDIEKRAFHCYVWSHGVFLPCNPVVDGSGRVVDVSGNVSLLKILQTRKDWDTTSTICFIFDLIMIPVFLSDFKDSDGSFIPACPMDPGIELTINLGEGKKIFKIGWEIPPPNEFFFVMDIRSSFGFCRGYHVPKRVTTHPQRLLRPVHYNVPKVGIDNVPKEGRFGVVAMSLKVMMDVVEWVAPPPGAWECYKRCKRISDLLETSGCQGLSFLLVVSMLKFNPRKPAQFMNGTWHQWYESRGFTPLATKTCYMYSLNGQKISGIHGHIAGSPCKTWKQIDPRAWDASHILGEYW